MTDPVTLGVLGAGIMGRRLLQAAGDTPAVRVSGVWDPASASLAALGADLPGTPVLPSAEAVLAVSDCVYIASPPGTHLPHIRAALAAGRAVFCEKPLAVDVVDASRLLADGAARRRVTVNFPFASALPVAQLRRWIEQGVVGVPRSASIAVGFARWPRGWQHGAASWLDGPAQGGFVREVVSHFLFLAHRLFGPLVVHEAAVSFPEPGRSERAVTGRLTAGAVPVSLEGAVGRTDADDSNLFTIAGTTGSVRLRDWATAERLIDGAWSADPGALPHTQARPLTLVRQLEAVADLVCGRPHHLATLAEAFAVQEAVETILKHIPVRPA